MSFSPAPLNLDEVLDAGWLSAALSEGRAPVKVKAFQVVETIGPAALKIRLELAFDGTPPDDIPSQVCIKGVFDPALTQWLKSGAQQAEAKFYKYLAPRLDVRVPRPLYAGFDPDTMNGLVVTEDLIPKGARFLSALSPYAPEQARQSLNQLARLHAGGRKLDLDGLAWLKPKLGEFSRTRQIPADRLTELLKGERGDALPDRVKDGARIYAALGRMDAIADRLGHCLVHGDAHAGNVWEGPDGIGLVDWQVVQLGPWSMDVAYHVATALSVEDRRRTERELLRHYLERLRRHGGPDIAFEEAWPQYQASVPYGLFMWGITMRVDPPIIRQFVTRLGTAVADHGSFELLGV